MLASVLIHWLGANFPHHSPEMTTATWQTVETWPSCCPNSLGAPVFHGTRFLSFIIREMRRVQLSSEEVAGDRWGKKKPKRIKRKMSNENSRLRLPQTYSMESRLACLHPLFLHFQLKVHGFMSTDLQNNVKEKTLRQHFKSVTSPFKGNRWLVCNDGAGWSIERCLAGKKTNKGNSFHQ